MIDPMWSGHWLWLLTVGVILVVPVWRICLRLGLSGWISLLILLPVINVGLLYYIAFSDKLPFRVEPNRPSPNAPPTMKDHPKT